MSKYSGQDIQAPKKFELGHLGSLNQVIKALGKVIRAMAADEIDSQKGARICNGLGIMRTCLETETLQRLQERLDDLQGEVAQRGDINGIAGHDCEAQRAH